MQTKQWIASDAAAGTPIGPVEFEAGGEWRFFDLILLADRILFGGFCNACFLESGFIPIEEGEEIDGVLSELMQDLICFYQDGPQYVEFIVVNERM